MDHQGECCGYFLNAEAGSSSKKIKSSSGGTSPGKQARPLDYLLEKIPRRPALQPAQNVSAFTTSDGELIEIHVLHQPEQR
jgi:hypothetical protein